MAMDLSSPAETLNSKRRPKPSTPTAMDTNGSISKDGQSRGRKRQRVSVSEEDNPHLPSLSSAATPVFDCPPRERYTAPVNEQRLQHLGLDATAPGASGALPSLAELPVLSPNPSSSRLQSSCSVAAAGCNAAGVDKYPQSRRNPLSPRDPDMKTFSYPAGFRHKRRKSVSAEVDTTDELPYIKQIFPKNEADLRQIREAMSHIFLFQHIDSEQQTELENAFQEQHVRAGAELITEGAEGDYFYIVKSGHYEVLKRQFPTPPRQQQQQESSSASSLAAAAARRSRSRSPLSISSQLGRVRVSSSRSGTSSTSSDGAASGMSPASATHDEDGDSVMAVAPSAAARSSAVPRRASVASGAARRQQTFSPGDVRVPAPEYRKVFEYDMPGAFFGELALMYNCARAASVRATTDGSVWKLNRATFKHILTDNNKERSRKYDQFVRNVPLLRKLSHSECSKIADCLTPKTFQAGEVVIHEGDTVDQRFYIVESGQAIATQCVGGVDKQVGVVKEGDYFGEKALICKTPRAATVTASGGPLKVSFMDRASFERLLGPLRAVMERKIDSYRSAK